MYIKTFPAFLNLQKCVYILISTPDQEKITLDQLTNCAFDSFDIYSPTYNNIVCGVLLSVSTKEISCGCPSPNDKETLLISGLSDSRVEKDKDSRLLGNTISHPRSAFKESKRD